MSEKEAPTMKEYFDGISEICSLFGIVGYLPEIKNEIEIPEEEFIKAIKVSSAIVRFAKKISPEIFETVKEIKEIQNS